MTSGLDIGHWLIIDAETGERITFGMKKDQARDIADNVIGPVFAISEAEYDRMMIKRGRTEKHKDPS
jgi:hypothetical protein